MRLLRWLPWGTLVMLLSIAGVLVLLSRPWQLPHAATWHRLVSPGLLSAPHAFLETNCAACHTAVTGVEATNCIVCHADNTAVLQRQPTAFHASITSCSPCHVEHQGIERRPSTMDHVALARIGLQQLKAASQSENESMRVYEQLVQWINQQRTVARLLFEDAPITRQEARLQCVTCHENEDRHLTLFGQDCAQCHATATWTLAAFRHPAPRSRDCAQCHQAPPSHYMEHFRMISMRVAGKPHAQVNQCYLCHQTTSWPDIQRVGWYKHH